MMSSLTCLVPCRLAVLVCVNVVLIFVRVVLPQSRQGLLNCQSTTTSSYDLHAVLTKVSFPLVFRSGIRLVGRHSSTA